MAVELGKQLTDVALGAGIAASVRAGATSPAGASGPRPPPETRSSSIIRPLQVASSNRVSWKFPATSSIHIKGCPERVRSQVIRMTAPLGTGRSFLPNPRTRTNSRQMSNRPNGQLVMRRPITAVTANVLSLGSLVTMRTCSVHLAVAGDGDVEADAGGPAHHRVDQVGAGLLGHAGHIAGLVDKGVEGAAPVCAPASKAGRSSSWTAAANIL